MSSQILTPIYLNSLLLQDLTSILIGGYFSNRFSRNSHDNLIIGRMQNLNRNTNTENIRATSIPINPLPLLRNSNILKCKNNSFVHTNHDDSTNINYEESILELNELLTSLESRNSEFRDSTVTRQYSLFAFNEIIIEILEKLGIIKTLNVNNPKINDIHPGDYIKFIGTLNINTVSNYVSTIINLLNSYDTSFLDTTFNNKEIGPLSYAMILRLLTIIQNNLARGNTSDAIVKMDEISAVTSLITTSFNQSYVFDSNNAPCIVFGKVTNVVLNPDDNISLLRKTGLDEYYVTLLNSFIPYLQVLNDNGFIFPMNLITEVHSPALQITPISICI
ncbi:hypothetical protein [Clostridium sp.]|uniref:DUF6414 family protein n=1 Tax=Clostridium sp. TaxID=1506 RepID=UPI003216FBA9